MSTLIAATTEIPAVAFARLSAFLASAFKKPATHTSDDGVWTSGARGL